MTDDAGERGRQIAREAEAIGEALVGASRRTRGPRRGLHLSRRRLEQMPAEPLDLGDLANLAERPRTRAECPEADENGRRACPWCSCRHHAYLEPGPAPGSLVISRPDLEPHELPWPCTLDLADQGGATLDDVGAAFGLSKERARQIERDALAALRARLADPTPEVDHMADEDDRHEAEMPCEVPLSDPAPDGGAEPFGSAEPLAASPPDLPARTVVQNARPTLLGAGRRVDLELLARSVVFAPAPAAPVGADERPRHALGRRARKALEADRRALVRLLPTIDRAERPEEWRPLVARYVRLLERVEPAKLEATRGWA